VSAGQQPLKRKGMLPVFRLVAPLKNILDLIELLTINEWNVSARVKFPLPDERTTIKGIFQRTVEMPLGQLTGPSFCTTASERVYITTSSGNANGGSQGAVGDRRAAICGANAAGAGGL
jgi:hypothetical protein